MSTGGVLIRVDASAERGTGHAMRMFALAQALLERQRRVAFVAAEIPDWLSTRLVESGVNVERLDAKAGSEVDALLTARSALDQGVRWVVVDGYHFGQDYQRSLREGGLKVMVVDDFAHLEAYEADILLNQNVDAENLGYRTGNGTRLLLGPRYVLLRREFWGWIGRRRGPGAEVRRVLVTFGGSDPADVTARVLQAVSLLDREVDVVAVVGASNRHYEQLQARYSGPNVRLVRGASDMAGLMAAADLAVSAAGTTVWELAFMGVPTIVAVVAQNQERIARALGRRGVVTNLGWHSALSVDRWATEIENLIRDREAREEMSRMGRALVDGRGVFRVADELL